MRVHDDVLASDVDVLLTAEDALGGVKAAADVVVLDAEMLGNAGCCEGVINIVEPGDRQLVVGAVDGET